MLDLLAKPIAMSGTSVATVASMWFQGSGTLSKTNQPTATIGITSTRATAHWRSSRPRVGAGPFAGALPDTESLSTPVRETVEGSLELGTLLKKVAAR